MMTLGSNIRTARKKMGLTQEELASQVGVTPQAVSRWESSAGLPDISLIVPLAQILSVSTDTLFGLEETRQDDAMYMEVKFAYEEIAEKSSSPAETAKKQCGPKKSIRTVFYGGGAAARFSGQARGYLAIIKKLSDKYVLSG